MDAMKCKNALLLSLTKLSSGLEDGKLLKESRCAIPADRSLQLICRSEGQETHYDTKLVRRNLNLRYYHKTFHWVCPLIFFLKELSFSSIHLRNAILKKVNQQDCLLRKITHQNFDENVVEEQD